MTGIRVGVKGRGTGYKVAGFVVSVRVRIRIRIRIRVTVVVTSRQFCFASYHN